MSCSIPILNVSSQLTVPLCQNRLNTILVCHFLLDLQAAGQQDFRLGSTTTPDHSESLTSSLRFERFVGPVGSAILTSAPGEDYEQDDIGFDVEAVSGLSGSSGEREEKGRHNECEAGAAVLNDQSPESIN